MIRRVVDFALDKRLFVLAFALLLIAGGVAAFHALPIEAYPDVADNYVEIVTQWPGISAEQMEQQITIPLEIVMNGMPHVTHLRSFSLFGLSDIKLIFDDDELNAWDRERALERLSQVSLPPAAVAAGVRRKYKRTGARGPDLLLHVAYHQSGVRRHGAEVDRGLGGGEELQGGS